MMWLKRKPNFLGIRLTSTKLCAMTFSSGLKGLQTPLFKAHNKLNAKLVDYAGYQLPIVYKDHKLIESHLWCRSSASIFDVSHMGQFTVHGEHADRFLEFVTVADMKALEPGMGRLASILNAEGKMLDDCIVHKHNSHCAIVVNGACKHTDEAWLRANLSQFNHHHGTDVQLRNVPYNPGLIALQGPHAMSVLQALVPSDLDLTAMKFMNQLTTSVNGVSVVLTRCGYTGEDGFEISMRGDDAEQVWDVLLTDKRVKAAGLGVRDSLRLEAGLCLYGTDIDDDVTPIEAGLNFTITKRRRAEGGFNGFETIQKQLQHGVTKKLVGMHVMEGAPARAGSVLLDADTGEEIGHVTSGTLSPSLKVKIAMGYVKKEYAKKDTSIAVKVRDNISPATIVKMPFVSANYYRG